MPATGRSLQTEKEGAGGVGGCGAAGGPASGPHSRRMVQLLSLAPTTLLPPVPSLAPRGCSQSTPAHGRGTHSGWFKQVREFGPSSAWGHSWGLAKMSLEFIHSSQGSRAHSSYLLLSLTGVRTARRSEGAPPEPSSPCPLHPSQAPPPSFWHISAAPFSASTSESPNQPKEELGELRELKQTGGRGL